MKNQVEIKKEASNFLREAKFELAFLTLKELGVEDFINYILIIPANKKFWLENKAGEYFWNEFLFKGNFLHQILLSPKVENLYFHYFNCGAKISSKVINASVQHSPELMIKLIRVNRLFIRPDIYKVLSECSFVPELSPHLVFWQKTNAELETIFKEMDSLKGLLSKLSPTDLLCHCTIWLEEFRFKNGLDKKVIHQLSRVYSYFIEKVLAPHCKTNLNELIDISNFRKEFSVIMAREGRANDSVNKMLNLICHLVSFLDEVVNLYCFNLEEVPIIENDMLYLTSTPINYYKWKLDGIRYDISQLRYHLVGSKIVNELESAGEILIPKVSIIGDENINRLLAQRKYGTIEMLKDLCIKKIKINSSSSDISQLLSTLITYSTNRFLRYENPIRFYFANSNSYKEAYIKQRDDSFLKGIPVEPFIFMKQSEYIDLNKSAIKTSQETSEEIISNFSIDPINSKDGGRYKCYYDVFQKPFLKIGDYIFCPTLLFANNQWFFSFVQEALMLRKRGENSAIETSEMEKQLGECFKRKNWKVKVITQEEANTISGDVDIIVEDDSDTLFVQLKRTFLRLNTEDIYNESILVDGPGRKQLVDAEAFLKIQNEIYNIKYPITKWLVSTSFENVNSEIDECRKINYFELINAISNPETKTLKQLIEDLVKDKSIRALYNSVISAKEDAVLGLIKEDFGLPLASFELKEYKKVVFTLKKETSIRYKDIFDKAIDLDKNGNKEKAISLLEKCIAMDEKDAEAFGALANVYADVKNYSKAFYSFEAALRLLPNDPMITRNYALALIENGNFFQGISLQLQLLKLFPFLGDTNYEIKHNMIVGVQNRMLNENEFKTLNKILMDLE